VADLSDVTAYLATQAAAAVYPSGSSQPSVAAMDCLIYEGWPIPDALDKDMAGTMAGPSGGVVPRPNGPRANVSIFPMLGTGKTVYQILDETYVVTPVVYGMTPSLSGNVTTVSGQPNTGEYLTLILDRAVVISQTGANTAALLAALAAQAVGFGYTATSTATTLTITPTTSIPIVLRQGGMATLGKVTHRQCHAVMVTVWAPTRVSRTALASAIDNVIKQTIKVTMPDTSQALIIYSRTNVSDEMQATTIYRRDLIYDVEYATVQEFPGYVITTVNTSVISAVGAATATALT
jgi:hypothetical protein